jgi:hypothetical protein
MSEISPQQKQGSLKKKREEQGLKKRGETSVEKLHVLKKRERERILHYRKLRPPFFLSFDRISPSCCSNIAGPKPG